MYRLLVLAFLFFPLDTFAQEYRQEEGYKEFVEGKDSTPLDTRDFWWITEEIGNTERSWKSLLDFHMQHRARFEESKHEDERALRIKALETMIEEKEPVDKESLDYLLWDLRNTHLVQFVQPNDGLHALGWNLDARHSLNPAEKLFLRQGLEAVDTLINHLEDQTLTRSVNYWRDFTYSHSVLSVGDLCQQILDRLISPARIFELEPGEDPAELKAAMKKYYKQRADELRKRKEPSNAR